MKPITHRFTLDMHSVQSQISIPVLLGDTCREFRIILSDGGVPYIIEDGCLAKISIKRPTGSRLEDFCPIQDCTTIVYNFEQNENTVAVEGIHDCDVTLYGLDGKSIASPRFTMVVSERVINADDIVITDEDLTVIDAMVKKEAERQSAETIRITAEADRTSAENDRADAEIIRMGNEEDRNLNEFDRKSNEEQRIHAEDYRLDNERKRIEKDDIREALVAQAVEDSSSAKADSESAVLKSTQALSDTASFRNELGTEALITGYPTVKGSVNHAVSTAKDAKDKSDAVETDLVNLQAQVNGISRSYVVYDFPNFIKFLNGEGRLNGGVVVNGILGVHINSLKTGDNILIKEHGVPDFWIDKNSTDNVFDTYTYNGVEYSLHSSYGGAHILETDYTVIEGHAISAAKSASDAEHYRDLASDDASFCASEASMAQEYKSQAEASSINASEYAKNAKASADNALASANIASSEANRATSIVNNAKSEIGAELSPMVSQNTEDIAINRKRITNLEQGITPDPFVTDTTGIVPVNALPYAEVVKVGGMTYRDEATNTLKEAKPTSIESRGANLIPFPYADGGVGTYTSNGVTFTVREDGSVYAKGTTPADAAARFYLARGIEFADASVWAGTSAQTYNNRTFRDVSYFVSSVGKTTYIEIGSGKTVDKVYYPMIHEGETALPYMPYRGVIDNLAIPEAVQDLDGYGLGISADCYNHVDWEKKQFVSMVASHTFTGTETVSIRGQNAVGNNVFLMSVGFPTYYREKNTPMLIGGYNYKGTVNAVSLVLNANDDCGSAYSYYHDASSTRMMYFVSSANSVDVFLADLAKKEMQYKLVEPIMTDISDLLPDDNFIEVEGGGTIVAVNENNLEAPTEITYMMKEVTA